MGLDSGGLGTLVRVTIIITGGSGLIGTELRTALTAKGHRVKVVSRDASRGDIVWDPASGTIDESGLEAADAIIHLAGESIAGRWTKQKKQRILDSRVQSTRLLREAVARLDAPPKVFLSGSAIGYYGDQGTTPLDETGANGDDFLSDVVKQWEGEAAGIGDITRLAYLRTGVVLTPTGGALAPLRIATKFFVGGPLGSGDQIWSWISIDDHVRAVEHLLDADVEGPVNLTAPNPVSQGELVKRLGDVMHRPTFMPAPRFAVRAVLGEMADALIFTSAKVLPTKLLDSGFEFLHDEVGPALEAVLSDSSG